MEMKTKVIHKNLILLGSILLLFAAAAAYVVFLNFSRLTPSGNDIWGHLYKVQVLYDNLREGNFYPLFGQTWYNGSQLYRYWAPVTYYLMALLTGICRGNLMQAYRLLAGVSIFLGGIPWIILGRKQRRYGLGLAMALLWFFLPESCRVFFCEGNLPRIGTAMIIPYVILAVWSYIREGKKRYLAAIAFSTMLLSLTHVMITAMMGVSSFLFLLFDSIKNKNYMRNFWTLCSMVLGIMCAGLWLVPALSGGMISMESDASSNVMAMMMSSLSVSLNPFNRINGITDTFYFGISIVVLSLLGILLSQGRKKSGYFLALLILLCTAPEMLPFLKKLPMNQLFWMMRFATIVYGYFFLSLIEWRSLRKKYEVIFMIILIIDCIPSLALGRYRTEASEIAVENTEALRNQTTQRAALLDLSTLGSYPSYGLCIDQGVDYTYGWAWQGATTSHNIVMLNTALEEEAYVYLFDRALELGNDAVSVVKDHIGDKGGSSEMLFAAAEESGYRLVDETGLAYVFKKSTPDQFGVVTRYEGLAIGKYADNMTLYYPKFTVGASRYVDDYSVEKLCEYKSLFLSGFLYHDRKAAEELLEKAADQGVRVIVDMTHVPSDATTKQQQFLNAASSSVTFTERFPLLNFGGETLISSDFSEENKDWNTGYLSGNMKILGTAEYEDEELVFAGADEEHDNIIYLGFNLMYQAVEQRDASLLKILDQMINIPSEQVPVRTLVPIQIHYQTRGMEIEAEGSYTDTVINTTLAQQDIFDSDRAICFENNLTLVSSGKTVITYHYPLFGVGLMVSGMGIVFLGILLVVVYRWEKAGKE